MGAVPIHFVAKPGRPWAGDRGIRAWIAEQDPDEGFEGDEYHARNGAVVITVFAATLAHMVGGSFFLWAIL
ncbi:hypothetical protein [Rhizobium sp. BK251]|uniref:hypothetical protein n=1 Tax=Rhizobium sp. BK251 TaxID=2512125 RepID=UPI0010522BEA|nr:hypothetical protein [Rhizobium sp. BK251]TCL74056.1 hypothetical protein EV286_103596 [Rhizobium sp. BK251]